MGRPEIYGLRSQAECSLDEPRLIDNIPLNEVIEIFHGP